jgi:hypothetical protein
MKTKTVMIVCLISGFLAVAQPAWAAPKSFESRQHARQTRRPALSTREVSGVIFRAIRGGDALQMLNPSARAKYGTANESISIDPDVPGKVNGIIFVSVPF